MCDGTTDGPTKHKVQHLQDLDKAEDDSSVLCQGSSFKDRVFFSENKERTLICKILTDTVSYNEQVLSAQPLEFLAAFCQQSLDLRSAENNEKQNKVATELPALWQI